MSFKAFLHKIFNIKKTGYTLSEEEIDNIAQDKLLTSETTTIDVDEAFKVDPNTLAENQQKVFEKLIIEIYEEAKLSFNAEEHNLWAEDLDGLESYKNLISKSKQEQKEFILFLLNRIIDQELHLKKIKKISDRFKSEIVNRLLRFRLPFNEEEIHFLMGYLIKDDGKLGYWVSIKLVVNQLKPLINNRFSDLFLKFLKSFLNSDILNTTGFDSYTAQISIIQRVLQNNSGHYRQDSPVIPIPLYLLIPDYFGKFVNKKVLSLETDQKEALSELMYKFSAYPNIETPKDYYNINKFIIDKIEIDKLKNYCKVFLERASLFKPKVRMIYSYTDYRGHFYYCKYEPISKENLTVIRGFVFLTAYFKLNNCLPDLHKLIERSYSKTDGFALGNGHKTVGEPCVQVLMHYFGNKGHKILIDIYKKTKFKSLKSRIEKEAKKLQIDTNVSFMQKLEK